MSPQFAGRYVTQAVSMQFSLAELETRELRRVAELAIEAAALTAALGDSLSNAYVELAASCMYEHWRRTQQARARCGRTDVTIRAAEPGFA